ncbi:hypothetical protein SDC9_126678 [bioreactor metagenome]|uniref:Uncharacterized protein n=1 Tax=bioreactor metagenome TaxID=1076179 RepID=A0A645CRW4_9ZZZZ
MLTAQGCIELKLGAPRDHIPLMADVVRNDLLEVELLRFAARDGDHVDPERHLQIGILEEILQDALRVAVLLDLDDGAHARSVALIANIRNAGEHRLLFLTHGEDFLQHVCLVDLKRQLGDYDQRLAVLLLFKMRLGAHIDLAAPGAIGLLHLGRFQQEATGWKVRRGDDLHQLFQRNAGVIHHRDDGIDRLHGIVRGNVCGEADRDAAGSVDQQVRETPR